MPRKTPQPKTPLPNEYAPATTAKNKPKLDPEILAIRAKYREEVNRHVATRKSFSVLQRIIKVDLPRLNETDREKLFSYLSDPNSGKDQEQAAPVTPSVEGYVDPWTTE